MVLPTWYTWEHGYTSRSSRTHSRSDTGFSILTASWNVWMFFQQHPIRLWNHESGRIDVIRWHLQHAPETLRPLGSCIDTCTVQRSCPSIFGYAWWVPCWCVCAGFDNTERYLQGTRCGTHDRSSFPLILCLQRSARRRNRGYFSLHIFHLTLWQCPAGCWGRHLYDANVADVFKPRYSYTRGWTQPFRVREKVAVDTAGASFRVNCRRNNPACPNWSTAPENVLFPALISAFAPSVAGKRSCAWMMMRAQSQAVHHYLFRVHPRLLSPPDIGEDDRLQFGYTWDDA